MTTFASRAVRRRLSLEAEQLAAWLETASRGCVALGPLQLATRNYRTRQGQALFNAGMDSYARGEREHLDSRR